MKFIKPCYKCPYKLGLVKTFVNPCPQCKFNGYSMYAEFQNRVRNQSDGSKTK